LRFYAADMSWFSVCCAFRVGLDFTSLPPYYMHDRDWVGYPHGVTMIRGSKRRRNEHEIDGI
jgi:hypothetical protein